MGVDGLNSSNVLWWLSVDIDGLISSIVLSWLVVGVPLSMMLAKGTSNVTSNEIFVTESQSVQGPYARLCKRACYVFNGNTDLYAALTKWPIFLIVIILPGCESNQSLNATLSEFLKGP